ncbi:hypothetical protein Q7P37_001311 [Cladosporium fusiforme]
MIGDEDGSGPHTSGDLVNYRDTPEWRSDFAPTPIKPAPAKYSKDEKVIWKKSKTESSICTVAKCEWNDEVEGKIDYRLFLPDGTLTDFWVSEDELEPDAGGNGDTMQQTQYTGQQAQSAEQLNDTPGQQRWQTRKRRRSRLRRGFNDYSMGCPSLTTFQNSSEIFTIYRRFGYLKSRLQLKSLTTDEIMPRQCSLEEIEKAFNSYAIILASVQSLQATKRPSAHEYRSVRNYLVGNAPLQHDEQDFIRYKEALIALRPSRDHAWMDRRIEQVNVTDKLMAHLQLPSKLWDISPFHPQNFPPTQPSQETSFKSRPGGETYYTRTHIELCASVILTAMVTALLIIPIDILYKLVRDSSSKQGDHKSGTLDAHATGVCIGILLVCTLLFSSILTPFTRAKRHEVLGAAAA